MDHPEAINAHFDASCNAQHDASPAETTCVWCNRPLEPPTRRFGDRTFHVHCYYELGQEMLAGEAHAHDDPTGHTDDF